MRNYFLLRKPVLRVLQRYFCLHLHVLGYLQNAGLEDSEKISSCRLSRHQRGRDLALSGCIHELSCEEAHPYIGRGLVECVHDDYLTQRMSVVVAVKHGEDIVETELDNKQTNCPRTGVVQVPKNFRAFEALILLSA